MNKLMVCAALALMAGCGAAPLKCEPTPVVEVPVAIGCLGDAPARPVKTYGAGNYPGDKAAAQSALIDAAAWEGYAVGLEAAQAGCDHKPAKPL